MGVHFRQFPSQRTKVLVLKTTECRYHSRHCENSAIESFAHLIFQELWLSDVLKEALWNVEKLMSFVGVDQAPVEPSDADTCGINRYNDTESSVVVELRIFGLTQNNLL